MSSKVSTASKISVLPGKLATPGVSGAAGSLGNDRLSIARDGAGKKSSGHGKAWLWGVGGAILGGLAVAGTVAVVGIKLLSSLFENMG